MLFVAASVIKVEEQKVEEQRRFCQAMRADEMIPVKFHFYSADSKSTARLLACFRVQKKAVGIGRGEA